MRRAAFTLIELMVVVAIIALISGMLFWAMEESKIDVVTQAGERLAATFKQARLLAQRTGMAHGVTINVENAGDGAVLKNFSIDDPEDFPGRHWYAIIGPSKERGNFSTMPPLAKAFVADGSYSYPLLPQFVQDMRRSMIEEQIFLPRGTRFLATSDYDGGGKNRPSGYGYGRRWHGHFADGQVWAWGGYNRAIETTTSSYSGLSYQGLDGIVPYDRELDTNVHPDRVWGQLHPKATARHPKEVGQAILNASTSYPDGSLKEAVRPGSGFNSSITVNREGPDTTLLPGTPRPLLNGWWADCMLLFDFDGSCYVASGCARRLWFTDDDNSGSGRRDTPMEHDWKATGGFTVTICRDIDPEDRIGNHDLYDWSDIDPETQQPHYDHLQSAGDLLHSITPFVRVWVPALPGDPVITTSDHPDMRLSAEDLIK